MHHATAAEPGCSQTPGDVAVQAVSAAPSSSPGGGKGAPEQAPPCLQPASRPGSAVPAPVPGIPPNEQAPAGGNSCRSAGGQGAAAAVPGAAPARHAEVLSSATLLAAIQAGKQPAASAAAQAVAPSTYGSAPTPAAAQQHVVGVPAPALSAAVTVATELSPVVPQLQHHNLWSDSNGTVQTPAEPDNATMAANNSPAAAGDAACSAGRPKSGAGPALPELRSRGAVPCMPSNCLCPGLS